MIKSVLYCQIDEKIKKKIARICKKKGISMRNAVTEALEIWIEIQDEKNK